MHREIGGSLLNEPSKGKTMKRRMGSHKAGVRLSKHRGVEKKRGKRAHPSLCTSRPRKMVKEPPSAKRQEGPQEKPKSLLKKSQEAHVPTG